ncbi:DapH/DapD/GlmU-related protein [Bosea sp. 124]|uniref:DapH/DapD/GlmU-related protein n=1 Tax=Bosea sp. 124 TaxID=2135642 RepID=UPI000D363D53|nr:DapH/DapD/GlmU-related protein [Bosea sp. 124]PTM41739.1 putative colanic acid biosynthesis acetyltransferase WcaF [Bosea sp. 124]
MSEPRHPAPVAAEAQLDIDANRRAIKWSRKQLLARALWELLRGPLFAWTPRPLWGWRRYVLRRFGARIGQRVHIHPDVRIAIPWTLDIGDDSAVGERAILYALGPITIGKRATISQNAHLCAGSHDFRNQSMTLLKPPIRIGDEAWICADAFIGPGVTIGDRAVAGARAVVMRDVAPGAIVIGNPARVTGSR